MSIESYIKVEKTQSFDFLRYDIDNSSVSLELLDDLMLKVNETKNIVFKTLSKVFNRGDYIPIISANQRRLQKKLDTYNYIDLSPIRVYKPIGLDTTFNVLSEALGLILSDILTIEDRLLNPFFKWTGEVLNRPEKLSRVTVNEVFTFIGVKEYNDKLDSIFNPNDVSDTATFGELFVNNQNLIETIKQFNEYIKKHGELNPKKLMKNVNGASERSEVLVRRCKVNSDDSLCSTASRKVIADVFYEIGMELTLYSRLSYILFSTKTALEDTAKKIIGLF